MANKAFRFASLLQWRERERDEAGAAVGQALEAIRKVDEQRQSLESERTRAIQESADARVGVLSMDRLLSSGRYVMQLELQARSLLSTREQLLAALEQRQNRLVAAEAEVKRFEKLKELDEQAARKEQLRREQLSLDETVTNRYLEQRRKANS